MGQEARTAAAAAEATAFEMQERLAAAQAALHAVTEKEVRPHLLSRSALAFLGPSLRSMIVHLRCFPANSAA